MIDLKLLEVELDKPEFLGLTAAQAALKLNTPDIEQMELVSKKVINNYICSNNINLRLRYIIDQPQSPELDTEIPGIQGVTLRLAAHAGIDFLFADTGDRVDPNHENTRGLIAVLQVAGILTTELVDGFWNLFRRVYSRSSQLFQGDVSEGDVTAARNLDKIGIARQKVAEWQSILSDLEGGVERDLPEAQ